MAVKAFIVEDSSAIRESLAEALTELARMAIVGQESSAAGAARWLRDPANDWDLAVVDLLLEGEGSGLDVLRALKDRDSRRKVIVLTASASTVVRDQCKSLGADGVFDKSIETDVLLDWCIRYARDAAG